MRVSHARPTAAWDTGRRWPNLGTILTAIVTPFDEQLRVDEEAFVALMHHLAAHGSDGFVVCGTTGEAATLTDEEQLGLIELAVRERPPGTTIIAGAGSNDTRHAVHLTERATELGVDAILSRDAVLQPPEPRGTSAPLRGGRARHRPAGRALQHPGAHRHRHAPDLLARARADRAHRRRQAGQRRASCAPIDGLQLYAGDDSSFARTLDIGGAGGILVASHIVGEEMRRMVDEPEHRAAIDASLQDVYETLFMTASPTCTKAALELLGHRVGGLRLPMVEADEQELEAVRAMLDRATDLAGRHAHARERARCASCRSAAWARSART